MNAHPHASDTEFEDMEIEEGRTLIKSPNSRKSHSFTSVLSNQRVVTFVSLGVAAIFLVVVIGLFNQSSSQPIGQVTQAWTDKVSQAFHYTSTESLYDTEESIYKLIDKSLSEYIDPLPSCSILNANITHNMLHHQWMIQHRHVHSDCSGYAVTGQCVYAPSNDDDVLTPSSHVVTFTPKWLVFHINSGPGKKGTGGLADRMKGLLTAYGLSLLLGRSFALHVEDFVPFTATFNRGVIEWIPFESIDRSVREGGRVHAINWQGIWDHRPLTDREQHDWISEWSPFDIVEIEYNMNGFSDLMDHPKFFPAYRAFGFHGATEKGDMDVYWECFMESLFSYTQPVLNVLNPLLDQINRPQQKTWEQRSSTIPTRSQIIERQSVEDKALQFSRQAYDHLIARQHEQSIQLYRSRFSYAVNPSTSGRNSTSFQPRPLYCLQIRMGSNGQQQTNNKTIGFQDFEGFLQVDQLQNIFKQFESKISSHLDNNPKYDRSTATLFITGDSDAYLNFIPDSLLGSPMIVVPGRTAHIDMLQALMNDPTIMSEAVIKTIATHYMLGECDVAYVTESGFGPTALWRSRNRAHAEHPFEDQVWEDKFMINKKGEIAPYVHMRGAAGREYDVEFRAIKPETRAILEKEILVNQSLIESYRPDKHGKYQSSAHLDFQVPIDPACVKMKVYNL